MTRARFAKLAATWLAQAKAENKRGDHAAALASVGRALDLDPKLVEAWRVMADVKVGQRDVPGAVAAATNAIELDPRDALALALRSRAKGALRDVEAALADAERALALDDGLAPAWAAKGSAEIMNGSYDRAAADLTRALELDSGLSWALANRGVEDIILLSPPGFGAPVPPGFPCTRLAYRDWLISEIEKIGHPVDLLGHDWGAGHTYAVAAVRPDLLRSWAADCAGLVHPSYVAPGGAGLAA